MKYILVGTNRHNSKSLIVAQTIADIYKELGEPIEILDLSKVPLDFSNDHDYSAQKHPSVKPFVERINGAEGLVIVCPEYNGSFPGALKYFIDHWTYPDSFEHRPVCFVGLGGRFGGVRPIEHLQQVFGYRNAYSFPMRVFLMNVSTLIQDGRLADAPSLKMLRDQADGFCRFVRALKNERLDANSIRSMKPS